MFKGYLYHVANNKRVHETIGATNWSIKTSLISQTPSVGTGYRRLQISQLVILITYNIFKYLIDNDSRLYESVGIPALSAASQYDTLGTIIRMAHL